MIKFKTKATKIWDEITNLAQFQKKNQILPLWIYEFYVFFLRLMNSIIFAQHVRLFLMHTHTQNIQV